VLCFQYAQVEFPRVTEGLPEIFAEPVLVAALKGLRRKLGGELRRQSGSTDNGRPVRIRRRGVIRYCGFTINSSGSPHRRDDRRGELVRVGRAAHIARAPCFREGVIILRRA